MIWKAKMVDGKEILECHNGIENSFWKLDFDNVDTFSIIDSAQTFVNLDLGTGDFKLNNLDLEKLASLPNKAELVLTYDEDSQSFKFNITSLGLLNNVVLQNERINHISFDQTGVFDLNGIPFYMAFEKDGVVEEFKNKPPYTEIVHFKDAITDFTGSSKSASPYKRLDTTIAYTLGYKKEHICTKLDNLTFKLSLQLKYDVIQKSVTLNCIITANDNINGKLIIFFGNSQSTLDVNLYKDEPASLNRIITLM